MKSILTRIYHPGMSGKSAVSSLVEYIGNKNAAIGAGVISLLILLLSFTLFTFVFSILFWLISTIILIVVAKLIFYKPREIEVDIDGEDTVLSYVKDTHVTGESELVVHSQPGYGKETRTFIKLQLIGSISILDCRNITSVTDKSYNDIEIQFFHPIKDSYTISATSGQGEVSFKVLSQSADNCHITFEKPVRNTVTLNFNPA